MTIKRVAIGILIVVISLALLRAALFHFGQESILYSDGVIPVDSRIYADRYAPAIGVVSEDLDSHRISLDAPSLSMAVAVAGELVWAEARGYAALEEKEAATVDTAYAIASISKPITSTLVAALWEEGNLDLDTDIRQYVAHFPPKAYPITLRQLLSHQAGIRHYGFAWIYPGFYEALRNEQFDSISDSLELFKDDELLFEPDTSFLYSTYGYTLVSAVVEGATKQSFLDLLQKRILEPLGMHQTAVDDENAVRANNYLIASDDMVFPAPPTNASYRWAGGGMISTPTDLTRFGVAMLQNQLLSESTSDIVFTPRTTDDGQVNAQRYGLGWRVGNIEYGRDEGQPKKTAVFHHGGWGVGNTSILLLLPERDIVVAMVANTSGEKGPNALTRIAASIAEEFVDFQIQLNETVP